MNAVRARLGASGSFSFFLLPLRSFPLAPTFFSFFAGFFFAFFFADFFFFGFCRVVSCRVVAPSHHQVHHSHERERTHISTHRQEQRDAQANQ